MGMATVSQSYRSGSMIAYDEAEQEASDVVNESPPSKPEVMPLEPGLDPLDLDLLFMDSRLVPEDSSFPEESVTKEEPVPGNDAVISRNS